MIERVDGGEIATAAELGRLLTSGDRPALVLVRGGGQNLFVSIERRA